MKIKNKKGGSKIEKKKKRKGLRKLGERRIEEKSTKGKQRKRGR